MYSCRYRLLLLLGLAAGPLDRLGHMGGAVDMGGAELSAVLKVNSYSSRVSTAIHVLDGSRYYRYMLVDLQVD